MEIVIPALNEELRLPRTLAASVEYLSCQLWSSAIVVVDNGSVDRTVDVARACESDRVPVYTVGCSTPGKGAAIRRGVRGSTSRYVGFMDADLATPIETLNVVIPLLLGGEVAVIGSRHHAEGQVGVGQPWNRRMGGWAFRQVSQRVVGNLTDTQCGFKFFQRELLSEVLTAAKVDGFACDVEILLGLIRAGYRVTEIPVEWVDAPGSTFSAVRHGWSTFNDLLRLSRTGQGRA